MLSAFEWHAPHEPAPGAGATVPSAHDVHSLAAAADLAGRELSIRDAELCRRAGVTP